MVKKKCLCEWVFANEPFQAHLNILSFTGIDYWTVWLYRFKEIKDLNATILLFFFFLDKFQIPYRYLSEKLSHRNKKKKVRLIRTTFAHKWELENDSHWKAPWELPIAPLTEFLLFSFEFPKFHFKRLNNFIRLPTQYVLSAVETKKVGKHRRPTNVYF